MADTKTIERQDTDLKKPRMYVVILHNDDFTTMEFVVHLLMQVFSKGESEASALAWEIDQKDTGIAGVYTHEIAETKAAITISMAKKQEFPLQASIQPE